MSDETTNTLKADSAALGPADPFPVDALPKPARSFVVGAATAIGCDTSYLALPLLAMLGSAIGNSRRVELKRGWTVPAILWVAIVGESGTTKTPALRLVLMSIVERQRRALQRHAEEMEKYEVEKLRHDTRLAEWKRNPEAEPPKLPVRPEATRYIVSDTTVEALAPLLLHNPRGLLLTCDELSGWLGSFDRYVAGGRGSDAAHWLSMHSGEQIIVDRKTGEPRTICVPTASVSVCGGIQPGILHRALGTQHRESGLAARLLLSCPARRPKEWTDAEIDPVICNQIAKVVDRLLSLEASTGEDGEYQPQIVRLTADAKGRWIAYYNSHNREQVELEGEMAAAWAKLEEYAARLALIVHFVRWAANDETIDPDAVDAASIDAAVTLAEWFKREARRVYALLEQSSEDRDRRRLVDWIEGRGGVATESEAQQNCRWLRESGQAQKAFADLVRAGRAEWEQRPAGKRGKPPNKIRLTPPVNVKVNASFPRKTAIT